MKYIIIALILMVPTTSIAATATWTGKFEQLEQEHEGVSLWACNYKYDGKEYIRVMENYCQSSIKVPDNNNQGKKGNVAQVEQLNAV